MSAQTTASIVERLDHAIHAVCRELSSSPCEISSWTAMTEEDLAYHLSYGILSSGVTHESALVAATAIRESGLLSFGMNGPWDRGLVDAIRKNLSAPMKSAESARCFRYRFPSARAKYIADTCAAVYGHGKTLREILENAPDGATARARLIEVAKGIGPKQSSLFLRRVGYCSTLAVLDTHILKYLSLVGNSALTSASVGCIRRYEKLEAAFLREANRFAFPIGDVDLAIWITMRVAAKEAIV